MKINGNIVSCAGNFALRARCKVARGTSHSVLVARLRGELRSIYGTCQGLRMRIYIPQKITITVKNRLHSRQQPCRSPRQTVIGIGLRELFYQKVRLPSV